VLRTSKSPYGVTATADRAVAALQQRGITLFARIDHAGAARAVGLELADEELLVFGNPRAGTQLMQDDARIGYELPLKLLIWDANGQTTVGYRSPSDLAGEYDLADSAGVLEGMDTLLAAIVAEIVDPSAS
jgi:uncharacterized protein (DUF302 family)